MASCNGIKEVDTMFVAILVMEDLICWRTSGLGIIQYIAKWRPSFSRTIVCVYILVVEPE